MAGHSKWANIKHRKAAQDAKRGKIFTKLIHELVIAAKSGGDSPADNPSLRACIDKALAANMKRDTIDKAIARGAGNQEGSQYSEITYEGYGQNGVAVLVETLTDNKNRTVADVRHAFSKHGGNLGTTGSVSFLFKKTGLILIDSGNEDKIMEIALDAGAEDIMTHNDGSFEVETLAEDVSKVENALIEHNIVINNSQVAMVPENRITLNIDQSEKLMALIDRLDDLDDVQEIYHNAELFEH